MFKVGCFNNWFDGWRFYDDINVNFIDCKVYDLFYLVGWVSKEGIINIFWLLKIFLWYSIVECIVV